MYVCLFLSVPVGVGGYARALQNIVRPSSTTEQRLFNHQQVQFVLDQVEEAISEPLLGDRCEHIYNNLREKIMWPDDNAHIRASPHTSLS